MSNRMFRGIIYRMRDSIDRVIGILDENAVVVACSDLGMIDETDEHLARDMASRQEFFIRDGFTYKPMGPAEEPEYAVFAEGTDETALRYCNILAVTVASVKQYYDEKFDRSNFIKNVVLDNILPGDVYTKARELRFNTDVSRAVLLVRTVSSAGVSLYEMVQNLFPDKQKDFVFSISETDTVIVKEVRPGIDPRDLEKLARSIADSFAGETYVQVLVGIGTAVVGIKELAKSFKEAQASLEISKVFDTEKAIVRYDNLGIARLIYQLPTTLCEMYLGEVFRRGSIDSLDKETLFTIQKFFENNLNVSETSRKLFVHRNTLVYRLEKIKKLTGLDLREFDHAIVFKVALMVKKYLTSNPVKY